EIDRLAHRHFRRFSQVLVNAHRNEMRRRFGPWPSQSHVLANDELKSPGERRLKRGYVHFAVALSGMAVAGLEKRAGSVNRNIERRSLHKVFVIEISGMNPRRRAANSSIYRWR